MFSVPKTNSEATPLILCQLLCIGDESSNNQRGVTPPDGVIVMSQVSPVTPCCPGQWPSTEQVLTNKTQLQADQSSRQKMPRRKLLCFVFSQTNFPWRDIPD